MPRLALKRFIQEPSCCAIAASASIANFYNAEIDFQYAKKAVTRHRIAQRINGGLWSGQIGRLLNCLGFKKVTIISSDLDYLCYSWSRLSQANLIDKLAEVERKTDDTDTRRAARHMVRFLAEEDYQNFLKIDRDFNKHIKKYIDEGKPVITSFNWTMFFKRPKYNEKDEIDPLRGDYTEHAVCCNGYTKNGAYIVDSHHEEYTYSLKKYRTGRYHVKWEELMSCIGFGDVIIAENYDPDWIWE